MDFAWARKLGLIRKPASFISTISDERGEELMYAGMPISQVFEDEIGIGGVISLLWFRKRLPQYACKFIEMVLMMTADHGPAVAGTRPPPPPSFFFFSLWKHDHRYMMTTLCTISNTKRCYEGFSQMNV